MEWSGCARRANLNIIANRTHLRIRSAVLHICFFRYICSSESGNGFNGEENNNLVACRTSKSKSVVDLDALHRKEEIALLLRADR